eukprot:6175648-Pleurochrysis_carterae.AAC.2
MYGKSAGRRICHQFTIGVRERNYKRLVAHVEWSLDAETFGAYHGGAETNLAPCCYPIDTRTCMKVNTGRNMRSYYSCRGSNQGLQQYAAHVCSFGGMHPIAKAQGNTTQGFMQRCVTEVVGKIHWEDEGSLRKGEHRTRGKEDAFNDSAQKEKEKRRAQVFKWMEKA